MKKLPLQLFCISFFLINSIAAFSQDWIKQSPIPTPNTPYDIYCADGNTIIISCAEGVLKTVDKGLTWNESTKESPGPIIEFCFITDQTGWGVGNDLTIHKTIDGGDTWITQKESVQDAADLYSVCFVDMNKGWAVGEDGTVLFTDNGGEDWTQQTSNTTTDLEDVHFADELNGYCVGNHIVLKTTDGGAVWEEITNLSGLGYSEDVYCFNADTCIIIAGSDIANMVHYTDDGGENWTTSELGMASTREIYFMDDLNGWIVGKSGYGSYGGLEGTTWTSSYMTIWKSENGGQSWNKETFSNTTEYIEDISIAGSDTIYASGTGGFIIRTPDGGDTWYQVSKGISRSLYSGQFINSQLGYAVGEDGTIMVTPDAGDNWFKQSSGTSHDLHSIQFINSNTGWVVGNYGRIRKTVNNGATWNSQTSGVTDDLRSVCFTDALTGYVVGENGTILKTETSGSSWTELSSGVTNYLRDVCFTDSQTGWAVGSNGIILHTTDGGDTWNPQTSNTSNELNAVYFKNSQAGWATGNSGVILKTVDGGATWITMYAGVDNHLNSIYFLDANTGWIAGSNGFLIRTMDGGNLWAKNTSTESYTFNSVYFTDTDTGWVFGNNGTILKTVNGGGTYSPFALFAKPQLLEPANNSTGISLNPDLIWASTDEADSYRLQVSLSSFFSSTVIDEGGIADTTYSLIGLENNKRYYWRVGIECAGELIIWSDSYNFRTIGPPPSAPSLYSPDNEAEGVSKIPTLFWSWVSGAETYHLQVAGDIAFSSMVSEDSTITATDHEVGPLDGETTYYWRVRAKNTNGISPYSDIWQFTTGTNIFNPPSVPEPYSPDNGETMLPVTLTLSWSYISNADNYHLQVSEDPGFTALMVNDSLLFSSNKTVGPLEKSTTYFWRIRAGNEGGYSAWSVIISFTTESENWSIQLSRCVYAICFIDEQSGWAAGFDIFKTTDGGDTWDEIYTPSEWLEDICFIDSLTGWAVGRNGYIIKTTDGGAAWVPLNSETTDNLESVFFINSSTGWVTGDCGILKTTNGGETWINQFSPESDYADIASVQFSDENNGWAAGYTFLRTTDGGEHWNKCMVDGQSDMWHMVSSISFADENNGWAVGFNEIFKTADGGLSWHSQADLPEIEYNDVFFADELNGWIAGEQGIIMKTADGGASWDYLYSETSEVIKTLYFVDQDLGWIVAGCNIVKTETGGGEACALPAPVLDLPYNYADVFPESTELSWNPVPSALTYRLQVSNTGIFTDPILDEEGLTLTSYSYSDLDTGLIYFWRVNASNAGDTSHWSVTWQFTIYEITLEAPVPALPANGAMMNDPMPVIISWNETANADQYQLQVADNPGFNDPFFDEQIYFITSESIYSGFTNNTTYYWRVRAFDYSAGMSPWSEVWSFTISGLEDINESGSEIKYRLYPNPAHDMIYLEGFEDESINISVISPEGKILLQKHERGITHLDISDLQSGIYIVIIISDEMMITDYIVKQNN